MWNHHHLFLWSYNTDPYYMNAPHGSLGYNFNDYGQSEKPTWMTNWTLKGECYIWILVTLNNTIHTIPFHLNPNQELIQTNPHWCDNAKDGKPFIDWSAKHYKTLICLTDAFPYQQTSACGTYSSVRQSCGHRVLADRCHFTYSIFVLFVFKQQSGTFSLHGQQTHWSP